MNYKNFIYFFLIFLFVGCSKNNEPKQEINNENIISKDKMVEILVDFYLVESAIQYNTRFRINTRIFSNYYYKPILEKHKITPEDFHESIEYYSKDIDGIDEIYTEVISILSEKLSEVKNE